MYMILKIGQTEGQIGLNMSDMCVIIYSAFSSGKYSKNMFNSKPTLETTAIHSM